jgi:hypothetical protein
MLLCQSWRTILRKPHCGLLRYFWIFLHFAGLSYKRLAKAYTLFSRFSFDALLEGIDRV